MPASPSISPSPVRPPTATAEPERPVTDERRTPTAPQAADIEYDSWRVALHHCQSRSLEILS